MNGLAFYYSEKARSFVVRDIENKKYIRLTEDDLWVLAMAIMSQAQYKPFWMETKDDVTVILAGEKKNKSPDLSKIKKLDLFVEE